MWKCKFCGSIDKFETSILGENMQYGSFTKEGKLILSNGRKTWDYFDTQCIECLSVAETIDKLADWCEEEEYGKMES